MNFRSNSRQNGPARERLSNESILYPANQQRSARPARRTATTLCPSQSAAGRCRFAPGRCDWAV